VSSQPALPIISSAASGKSLRIFTICCSYLQAAYDKKGGAAATADDDEDDE